MNKVNMTLEEVARREGAPLGNLQSLCDWVRHYYFNDEIPPVKAIISRRLKRTLACISWLSDEPVMKIREDSFSDSNVLLDTICHELIHAWQGMRYKQTGDITYLDETLEESDKQLYMKGREFTPSHGVTFYQKVDALAEKHPELSFLSTKHSMIEDPLYSDKEKDIVRIISGENHAWSLFYASEPMTEQMKAECVTSFVSRMTKNIVQVDFLKTRHMGASTTMMRLKKDGSFPSHKKIYTYNKEGKLLRAIMQDGTTSHESSWSRKEAMTKIQDLSLDRIDNNAAAEIMVLKFKSNFSNDPEDDLYLALRAKDKMTPAIAVNIINTIGVEGYTKSNVILLQTGSLRLSMVSELRSDGRVRSRMPKGEQLFKSEAFCQRLINDEKTNIIVSGDYRELLVPMSDMDWWKANRDRFNARQSSSVIRDIRPFANAAKATEALEQIKPDETSADKNKLTNQSPIDQSAFNF